MPQQKCSYPFDNSNVFTNFCWNIISMFSPGKGIIHNQLKVFNRFYPSNLAAIFWYNVWCGLRGLEEEEWGRRSSEGWGKGTQVKQSIIKSCDILFSTIGGYYQVTEAKNDFLYSHALHTKPKHCLLTSNIAANNYMMLISLDPSKVARNDLKNEIWHPDMTNHRPYDVFGLSWHNNGILQLSFNTPPPLGTSLQMKLLVWTESQQSHPSLDGWV